MQPTSVSAATWIQRTVQLLCPTQHTSKDNIIHTKNTLETEGNFKRSLYLVLVQTKVLKNSTGHHT